MVLEAFRSELDWALGPENRGIRCNLLFSGVASFMGSRDALADVIDLFRYGTGCCTRAVRATPQVVPINSVATRQIIAMVILPAMAIGHTSHIFVPSM